MTSTCNIVNVLYICAAMSCITQSVDCLAENKNVWIIGHNIETSCEMPSINSTLYSNYSTEVSNLTVQQENSDLSDFEIIKGFAVKMLKNTEIDPEIQKVINDFFWDMI